MTMDRTQAWSLLCEYTQSESLLTATILIYR